jgi:hypothetical protein
MPVCNIGKKICDIRELEIYVPQPTKKLDEILEKIRNFFRKNSKLFMMGADKSFQRWLVFSPGNPPTADQ